MWDIRIRFWMKLDRVAKVMAMHFLSEGLKVFE